MVLAVADSPGHTILKKMKSTGKEIGRGAYGRVFEVEYGKIHYAAKEVHTILLQYASSENLQKIKADFLNECHIWDQLQHPCIVQFMGKSTIKHTPMDIKLISAI